MNPERLRKLQRRGAVAWMARNPVASNLLMGVLLIGGFVMVGQVKQEVFPEFTLDLVNVSVPYPGASPEEVEQGIVMVVEEGVRGLDGVKKVTSRALEGVAAINIELIDGTDGGKALSDIKAAVDRIASFPVDAEAPVTSLFLARNKVISLVIYGDHDEATLRTLVEKARDEVLQSRDVTQVELVGVRAREIAIEISQRALRAHGLTLSAVAEAIRRSSIDLPAGSIKAKGGETLLRTRERRDYGSEFSQIAVKSAPGGAVLRVTDLAHVKDGFVDEDVIATYNGQSAVQVDVYRVGDQTPIEVAAAVHAYAQALAEELPAGLKVDTWNDRSEILADRIDLLMRNAKMGLVLVFLALALFLEIKLAFWVMLGIPISFMGAFLLMPAMDVSVNMISLFAFIVTLGIVVDDAIVVGENIYELKMKGVPAMEAAIAGAKQVSVPVVFAVLTTIAAFSPLFFVPGTSGKFMRNIPAIVVAVIAVSLIESLFVLPAHLAHSQPSTNRFVRKLMVVPEAFRKLFSGALHRFIYDLYQPALRFATRNRYLSLAVAIALLASTVGVVAGGHLEFTFMPKVEGDVVTASARLPVGTPVEETVKVRDQLVASVRKILDEAGGEDKLSRGLYASVGQALAMGGGPGGAVTGVGGSHLVDVAVRMVPAGDRSVRSTEIANRWREANRGLMGLKSLTFSGALRTGGGNPIDVVLSHRDTQVLEGAARRLAEALRGFDGAADIDDGVAGGKRQLDIKLKPAAQAAGLTEALVARQLRDTFFGAEALRQQRGRDEVKVMVRLPEVDRETLASFENLMLRAPSGVELPLSEAATVHPGTAYTEIQREDGRRVIHVTGDVNEGGNAEKILAAVKADIMPTLLADVPGLTYEFEGSNKDRRESFGALRIGFLMALFVIYALLAVPFGSYLQPIIIMSAIPFGIIGAIAGHLLLGYDLSFISIMGIVALAGIVVNDSLIMVVAINELRENDGLDTFEAVVRGAIRRFRPILLTSLTTFFGLMPMIFETSVQARFLIPMAISLGFGVLAATFLILLVVPAIYLILEDLLWIAGKAEFPYSDKARERGQVPPPPSDEPAAAS